MLLAASLPLQSGTAFSPVLLFAFARLTDTPAPTNWTKGGAGSDSFVTRSGAGPTGADSSFVSGIDSAASWPALLFSIIRFVKTKWAEAGGVGSDSFVTRSGAGATGADSFVEGEESVACLSTGPAFWPALLFSIVRFVKTKWAEAGGAGSDSFVTRSGAGATGADSFVEGEESVACLSTGPAFWPALLFSIVRFVKTKWAEAGGVGCACSGLRSRAGPDSCFASGIDSAGSWPVLLDPVARFANIPSRAGASSCAAAFFTSPESGGAFFASPGGICVDPLPSGSFVSTPGLTFACSRSWASSAATLSGAASTAG